MNSIAPISIHGNGDLTPPGSANGCKCANLASGVFVIGPWQISGAPSDGVRIENVTAAFMLKDMTVLKSVGASIRLHNINFARADRKSTRLNSSHIQKSRMPSSA